MYLKLGEPHFWDRIPPYEHIFIVRWFLRSHMRKGDHEMKLQLQFVLSTNCQEKQTVYQIRIKSQLHGKWESFWWHGTTIWIYHPFWEKGVEGNVRNVIGWHFNFVFFRKFSGKCDRMKISLGHKIIFFFRTNRSTHLFENN